ncbi:hypothetical protein [Microcoleus sp. D3_18a_C4]
MPVPQEINFIVEQASCLFLTMVQNVRLNSLDHIDSGKVRPAHPTSTSAG